MPSLQGIKQGPSSKVAPERCRDGVTRTQRTPDLFRAAKGQEEDRHIPRGERCHGFQAVRISDHFIQGVDNLPKFGPVVSILLPTVKHQLVKGIWAVHGWWQPIVLLDGIYHLQEEREASIQL